MSDTKVIFVRHKFEEDSVRQLWKNKQIALRFENIPSIIPEDYATKSGHDAMKRLQDFCAEGVIVGASYRSCEPFKLVTGTIGPGDPNELIQIANINGYHHKVVTLEHPKEYRYRDHPLLAVQPRHGTISQWKIAGKYLRALYTGSELPRDVSSLAPGQLEVLCYEYLRLMCQIDALILPIGRSLRDIDIYGICTDGQRTIAQVTHSKSEQTVRKKRDYLIGYRGKGVRLFFFGPRQMQEKVSFEEYGIDFIATEEVFARLDEEVEYVHHYMIEHMLHGK
jgi:hypothetical protein